MRRRLDVLLREYKRKHSTGGSYRAACAVSKSGRITQQLRSRQAVTAAWEKAICKELGKTSVIVLAGRNLPKMEAAKAELDELGVESYLCKTDIADRAQVQALADYAASLGDVTQVIHTSGVSPSDTETENIIKINAVGTVNMVEAFYPALTEGGVMINFSSVAAYTMPQTDEWTQAFEAWNEPDFYDRLLVLAGEAEDEEGEFFRAGLAYAMSKKFVIYFTQKNVARFAEKHCRILSISPGCYLTPMHQKLIDNQPETAENQLELIPAGRWGHPYEMGALTVFLCSSGAGYINGVDILADGGQNAGIFVPQI